jgi:hypothetical protein
MRPQDRAVFSQAARNFQLWILVRRTNPESLKYIGLSGYVPKPIECKAKTADKDSKRGRLAGLVADPTRCPEAFSAAKLGKALQIWNGEFSQHTQVEKPGSRWAVVTDQSARHYGAVTCNGDFIYGDYDLYDIIDPDQAPRNLAAVEALGSQPHMRGPNFYKVQQFVNVRIGAPVVQHGGEMQYTDHSDQSIDAFGPAGEECTILNQFSVRGWYQERFGGRRPIAAPPR